MKKILIFGCSFTLGSYTIASKEFIPRENWIAPDKLIRDSYGWWYFVDYFKNKNITIIGFSGQGYWAYYQILLYLEEQNKLEYETAASLISTDLKRLLRREAEDLNFIQTTSKLPI